MDFSEYLSSKKIDQKSFSSAEPERFHQFMEMFEQMHPDSFTAQKLFLINKLRRLYPIIQQEEVSSTEKISTPKPKPRVAMKPKKKE